ncbi:hypothetical protein GCK32_008266 [Trichostrongylus colubriformis]|uniref:Uncharacterized protein n=1 Tax=Trichostrongylus colubriformis TaxID=6319 RepID=A0AAN8ITQ4_TRICO
MRVFKKKLSGESVPVAPDEPCIRIGDLLLSREQTTNLLAKLNGMKHEATDSQRRRYSNFNKIDSCRTSRAPSPRATDAPPQPNQQRRASGKESSLRGEVAVPLREPTTRVYKPRPNFNRIDSCRTSRASSPQDAKKSGVPKRRVRIGDHFMTVEEAEDLLQRMLKANARRAVKQPSRPASKESDEEKNLSQAIKLLAQSDQAKDDPSVYKVKVDNRVVAVPVMEPPKNEDADCNFSHLNSVIKLEDEVNAIILSIIVGAVLFLGLCMIVAKRT